MTVVDLGRLTPAAITGWKTLFDLIEADAVGWVLIGGQMMLVLAAEHGRRDAARATDDVDVVVNVRLRADGTSWLSTWLMERGYEWDGASPGNQIGHRFVRDSEALGGSSSTCSLPAMSAEERR